MSILVTGAAGYIGSHAVQRLLREGREVVALDNLSRGHEGAIARLRDQAQGRLHFARTDIADRETIARLITDHRVEAVMHFAALAYVGESVEKPLLYYRNNAAGALALLEVCRERSVTRFVFSSTCATYGEPGPEFIPIPENCPQHPINPYGRSKLHVEHMLADELEAARRANTDFAYAALRYFNVAGSDRTGVLGEDHDPETHLIPVVLQAAMGKRDAITIFGTDYPTPDGTCVRDYVHVEDLVAAHLLVLGAMRTGEARRYNVGIGRGYSVREIVTAAERVTGKSIRIKEGPRRAGDPPTLFADPRAIQRDLRWTPEITSLDDIIRSAWNWFQKHPEGYR